MYKIFNEIKIDFHFLSQFKIRQSFPIKITLFSQGK